jgi:Glycogen debranching enzyme N terminal
MELTAEWLEAGPQGGFACGAVGGERTRRYHALVLVATHPPGGRIILVNGIEAWVTALDGNHPLTSQRYTPDVVYPDGWRHLTGFSRDPWPSWRFVLPGGTEIVHELFVSRETSKSVLRWWQEGAAGLCRELLAHHPGQEAAHRMRLPAGRLHNGRNGRATRPVQQRQHHSLLGPARGLMRNGGPCPLGLRSALRSRSRYACPAFALTHFSSSHGRSAPARRTTATPRRPTGAGGGEDLGASYVGSLSVTTDALFT